MFDEPTATRRVPFVGEISVAVELAAVNVIVGCVVAEFNVAVNDCPVEPTTFRAAAIVTSL